MNIFVVSLAFLIFSFKVEGFNLSLPPQVKNVSDQNGNEVNFRIIGGKQAGVGQFPWQAYLSVTYRQSLNGQPIAGYKILNCGASLVSDHHLITAAHCLQYLNQTSRVVYDAITVSVKLGSVMTAPDGTEIITQQFLKHPAFNVFDTTKMNNDIGIIWLPQRVQLNPSVQPISLPSNLESFENEIATASGFGMTNNIGIENYYLNYVSMPVMSNQECRFRLAQILDTQLCTNNLNSIGLPMYSTCVGDSGGPLVVERNGRHILIGVTSHFYGTCVENPSVFTRITYYMDFIQTHMTKYV